MFGVLDGLLPKCYALYLLFYLLRAHLWIIVKSTRKSIKLGVFLVPGWKTCANHFLQEKISSLIFIVSSHPFTDICTYSVRYPQNKMDRKSTGSAHTSCRFHEIRLLLLLLLNYRVENSIPLLPLINYWLYLVKDGTLFPPRYERHKLAQHPWEEVLFC